MTTGPDSARRKPAHQTLTERVDRAIDDVIRGDRVITPGVKNQSLTEIEQKYYDELADEIRSGNLEAAGEVWKLDYVRKPPDMTQFLLDERFLGRTWKPVPGENEGIWPTWFTLATKHLDINSRIHNLVLTGSLGVGKTALMVSILLYRLCIATHLKNPQNFFGLNRNSRIVYNFLSVTKESVRNTAFGVAMDYMGDSAYFVEDCHYDPKSDYSGYEIPMLNRLPDGRISNLLITAGSKGQHVIGQNLVGIGLDEGNFRLEKDPDLAAYALYDSVRTRIANRFQKIASYLPALSVIASSAADESSFTEKVVAEIAEANRILDIENRTLPPGIKPIPQSQLVIRNAVYKIKRHALPGITPDHHWFKICYGLKNMEPYILSGWYREDGAPILDELHEEPPPGAKTELVPKFYWEAYRRNCKAQLQNLSGISVGGAHRLFSSMVDIEFCVAVSKEEGVPDPLKPGFQRIPVSSEDSQNIWDYLEHKAFLTRAASRVQPKRHPHNLRYAHLDLATQSLAGLSICHLAGAQLVEGLVRNGEPFSEYRLIVEYDFILTICAGESKPINFEKIQRFFFWLRDMCGYQFGLITADTWQSVAPLQALEARNFKVDKLSIDRDKTVYSTWRAGFEEHRIRLHRNEQMIREAEELLEMDKKYDHPPGTGSKDTCLCVKTKIRLTNGKVVALDALEPGKEHWIYAINNSGKICAAKATALGMTRRDAKLLEIKLDNGKAFCCTPDHLILRHSGVYQRADSLLPDDSLMPFSARLKSPKPAGHKVVCVKPADNGNASCLRVDACANFAIDAGIFVHNCDGAAGAFFGAVNSDEKMSISSTNAPGIYGGNPPPEETADKPPIEIPIPARGHTRTKTFEA